MDDVSGENKILAFILIFSLCSEYISLGHHMIMAKLQLLHIVHLVEIKRFALLICVPDESFSRLWCLPSLPPA